MSRLVRLFFLIVAMLDGPSVLADISLPIVPAACTALMLSGRDPKCDTSTWYGRALEDERQSCRKRVASPICQELIKKEPILSESLKSCEIKALCAGGVNVSGRLKGCAEGFLLGTGEGLESIRNWFEQAAKSIQQKNARFESLSNDIDFKRSLASGIPRYKNTSDAEFEKLSAAALFVERQNYEYALSTATRNSTKTLSLLERAEQAEALAETRAREPSSSIQETALFSAAYELLRKKGIELSCLDERTQAEMVCWGAAYLIDPVGVSALALKSGRLAKATLTRLEAVSRNLLHLETAATRIADSVIKGLPASMNVARYRNVLKEEFLIFERTVRMPDGSVKILARELPFDNLTGAIDSNMPAGRQFLESLIAESNGKAVLATIDIDNLGFVSKNFTQGKTGSPAELKQIARAAGDEYLRAAANVIRDMSKGKAQFFRTGGDEFALVFSDADPVKAQKLLQEISERVRKDPTVRRIFSEESKARAAAFPTETAGSVRESLIQEYRLGYAPYSQPNVSIGSVVVNGEELSSAFEIAEKQAAGHKIENKTQFKADTTKYGGGPPELDAKPNLTYLASVRPTAIGRSGEQKSVGVGIADASNFAEKQRVRERFQVGEMSIVEYKDGLGKPLLQMERFRTDATGQRQFVTYEVFMNERTGLIDARHPRGREILDTFVSGAKNTDRAGVWVNLEKLGSFNYGPGGTANGDRALAATSEALKKMIRADSLPLKWQGSEFFIGIEKISSAELKSMTERIQQSLSRDPAIQSIYTQSVKNIETELSSARLKQDSKRIKELEESLKNIQSARNTPFTVYSTSISPGDTLDSVLARTRGRRYED